MKRTDYQQVTISIPEFFRELYQVKHVKITRAYGIDGQYIYDCDNEEYYDPDQRYFTYEVTEEQYEAARLSSTFITTRKEGRKLHYYIHIIPDEKINYYKKIN